VARAPGCPVDGQVALADVLVRVSQLVVDFPEIDALSLDPLHAGAEGAVVERAVFRLRPAGAAPPVLAIAPYPAELTTQAQGKDETFLIRPIRPEDATAHGEFFARLPAQDVRFRFFSALRELSPEQTARLTQVDYDREIAFIAVREATRETVGVARLVQDPSDNTAEFAIVVQPDVKGQGLATRLMECLFAWARTRGVAEIVGQVLADNAPMLGFVRHLGFTLKRAPDDETVVEARMPLGGHR
ncbi:MAG TPA: GNAT family N-acetyltransferase, partial [Acetobacteraceae bacterium]|nr:GNAT family N-acetyltransferase [Acetobacteraceae bacterium]